MSLGPSVAEAPIAGLVITKLDSALSSLISQVALVRESVREMLKLIANFKGPENIPQIKQHINNAFEGIKKLAELGKKYETMYTLVGNKPGDPPPFLEERPAQLIKSLEGECQLKEIRDRSILAITAVESELRLRFPIYAHKKRRIEPKWEEIIEKREDLHQLDKYVPEMERATHFMITKLTEQIVPLSDKTPNTQVVGVKVVCKNMFVSFISFKKDWKNDSILLDNIAVFGPLEQKESVWDVSEFNVFQKITEHAREALVHFTVNLPDCALRRLIMWLSYYRQMFSVDCKGCGKYLSLDSETYKFLPPTFRTYDQGTPYHHHCYLQSTHK